MNVDPLASSYPDWSPYVFSGNRVIDRIELEGLEPIIPILFETVPPVPVETIMTEGTIPLETIPVESIPIEEIPMADNVSRYIPLESVTLESSPKLGFFERIGNAVGRMWDSIFGSGKDVKAGEQMDTGKSAPEAEPGQPYAPNEPLRRGANGEPKPDAEAAGTDHTQLGRKPSRSGNDYTQGREFNRDGKPVRDIDHTDHGRPNEHTNPHQHNYEPNPTGGTPKRGAARPLEQ